MGTHEAACKHELSAWIMLGINHCVQLADSTADALLLFRYLSGEASADWTTVLNALGGVDNFYTDLRAIKGSDMEVVVPTTGAWPAGNLPWVELQSSWRLAVKVQRLLSDP